MAPRVAAAAGGGGGGGGGRGEKVALYFLFSLESRSSFQHTTKPALRRPTLCDHCQVHVGAGRTPVGVLMREYLVVWIHEAWHILLNPEA